MKTTKQKLLSTIILSVMGMFIFFSSCEDDAKSRFEVCAVTFDSQGGSFTPATQETYTGGRIQMPSPSPKKGVDSVLIGWFSDPARTMQFDFSSPVAKSTVLYAKWRLRTEWVVDFDSKGGTSVETQFIPLGTAGYATLQDVYPTKANSSFGGWYLDEELTERFDFKTLIDEDYTLFARWISKNMMFVQGGTYMMGSSSDLSGSDVAPTPDHQVTVSDFAIGLYEVGNSDFVMFLNSKSIGEKGQLDGNAMFQVGGQNGFVFQEGKWTVKSGYENHPAVTVTWHGATAYCKWAGGRLPTEAEWEFAARGGNKTKNYTYIGGNDPLLVGWYYANSASTVQPRGGLLPNELGVYDMPGNAFEWCSDWAANYLNDGVPQINPTGPSGEGAWAKIIRGAAAMSSPDNFRPYYRNIFSPSDSYLTIGFRMVIP